MRHAIPAVRVTPASFRRPHRERPISPLLALLVAVGLALATSSAAAQATVTISGRVFDQYGKPPPQPMYRGSVDQGPYIFATRFAPEGDRAPIEVPIQADGSYTLAAEPGVWELEVQGIGVPGGYEQPEPPLVDTRGVATNVGQDVPIAKVDSTLSGAVQGESLDPANPAHVAIELWSGNQYKRASGAVGGWLKAARYQVPVAPGTWLRGGAVQSNDGGYEWRADLQAPLPIAAGRASHDWTLPSLSFEDAQCTSPHTCSATVHGTGWRPDAPVGLYVVQQARLMSGPPSSGWTEGHPAITTVADATGLYAGSRFAELQPDPSGQIEGQASGDSTNVQQAFDPSDTYTLVAVQMHPDGGLKVAQSQVGFQLPAFDPFSLIPTPGSAAPPPEDEGGS